jgi:hypothetical protein
VVPTDDGTSSGSEPNATAESAADAPASSDGDDPGTEGPRLFCGDGVADGDEECDGSDLDGESCAGMGGDGTLTCKADCTLELCDCTWGGAPPTCVPADCGNGVVDGDEECDGTDLDGQTCESLGGVGTVSCTDDCTLETCACIWGREAPTSCGPPVCGNGRVEGIEQCDGTVDASDDSAPTCTDLLMAPHAGTPACAVDCTYDTSDCRPCDDPDGEACIALLISEILYAPLADPGAKAGQRIELHNPTATPWDLQGCIITGDLGIDTFDIDVPLVLEAGGYATLGSGTALELGFTPDFTMPIGVGLFNDGDLVTITCDGVVVDTVSYDDAAPWPAVDPGTSIALAVLDAGANDGGAAGCSGATAYGPGHLGTPGGANDCP